MTVIARLTLERYQRNMISRLYSGRCSGRARTRRAAGVLCSLGASEIQFLQGRHGKRSVVKASVSHDFYSQHSESLVHTCVHLG